MKFAALLILAASLTAVSQQPETPKSPTAMQERRILAAIAHNRAAQDSLIAAQWGAQDANDASLATVVQVQRELGLDDTWEFNYQFGRFTKKVVPLAPPQPSPAPAKK